MTRKPSCAPAWRSSRPWSDSCVVSRGPALAGPRFFFGWGVFMKRWRLMLGCVAVLGLAAPAVAQDDAWYAWSPKPDKLPSYGKNKPVVRLPAVLARHKGQPRWSEHAVLTKRWDANWIQAAPGDKPPTQ